MRDLKKLILALLCLILLCVPAAAATADGVITDMKTDCYVNQDGSCQVTQTVTVDITGTARTFSIPVPAGAKRIHISGFSTRRSSTDGFIILTAEESAGITGSRTFTVQYTLKDAVSDSEDKEYQILTVPLLCPKWEYPIQSFSFTVTLPAPTEASPSFTSGYYGDVIGDYIAVTSSNNMFSGKVRDILMDHESLTMTLTETAGYFTGRHSSWSANWADMALVAVLAVGSFIYWVVKLRSKERTRSAVRSLPPDAAQPCDLPLLLASGEPDFAMLVCQWATLGYLTIHLSKRGHVILKKRVEMGNERRELDRKAFDQLFSRSNMCDSASILYKRVADATSASLKKYWNAKLYEKKSGNPRILQGASSLIFGLALVDGMSLILPSMPLRWLVLGLFFAAGVAAGYVIRRMPGALVLHRMTPAVGGIFAAAAALILTLVSGSVPLFLGLVLSVLTGLLTLHGGRRKSSGTQIITQVRGFRRHLSHTSESHLQAVLHRDPQYFYHTLPYAQAMGIGESFSRRFGGLDLEPCSWYTDTRPAPRTALEFYSHFQQCLEILEFSAK